MKDKAKRFGGVVFSQTGFFWLTLFVFMAVSVSESGDFFNKAITHGAFYGALGYAVAAVFDMLAIVFMMARLNASRIADSKGKWLALLGVTICAAISAFGNVASAVQTYDASVFNHIPAWMETVAPYLGLVFPSMVVFTTLVADHIGDLNPARADNIAMYRLKEMRKVELLKVRLEIERELAGVRVQMEALRRKPGKKQQRVIADLQTHYDGQIRELSAEVEVLKMLLPPGTDPDTDKLARVTVHEVSQTTQPQEGLNAEKTGDGQNGQGRTGVLFESKKLAVLAAMKAQPGATAAQVAVVVGCHPKTAQRWMDKLQTESEVIQ